MPTSNCPECEEDVYVDADSEQGDEVTCDECGAGLVVVGLDPIELDLKTDTDDDLSGDKDYDSLDYDGDDRY
jgi:lysine biosynthesis protein LysW